MTQSCVEEDKKAKDGSTLILNTTKIQNLMSDESLQNLIKNDQGKHVMPADITRLILSNDVKIDDRIISCITYIINKCSNVKYLTLEGHPFDNKSGKHIEHFMIDHNFQNKIPDLLLLQARNYYNPYKSPLHNKIYTTLVALKDKRTKDTGINELPAIKEIIDNATKNHSEYIFKKANGLTPLQLVQHHSKELKDTELTKMVDQYIISPLQAHSSK